MKRLTGCFLLVGGLAHGLAAQGDVRARLVGRVPPDVAQFVGTLADSALARGLPQTPLVDKALEGAAKSAAPDRINAAVRAVFGQLQAAAQAIRDAGTNATSDAVEAGAFALGAGLTASDVSDVARTADRNHPTAVALQVAGTLVALGVPRAQSVGLVRAAIRSGQSVGDLTSLPGQVQAATAGGQPPAAAAQGLERAAEARAQPHGKATGNPHKP